MSFGTMRLRVGRLIGLAFVLASVAPGCARDRAYCPRPDTTNVVQRPIYPVECTKPLYIGGYAGASYVGR